MEKPNADIEWYDDGFTMEEQVELSKAYFARRIKCKVTENQKENSIFLFSRPYLVI